MWAHGTGALEPLGLPALSKEKLGMANNYILFCEEIGLLTREELEWWISVSLLDADTGAFEKLKDKDFTALGLEPKNMRDIYDSAGNFPTFSIDTETYFDSMTKEVRRVYLFSEECGNPDDVAYLMMRFLKKFRPKSYLKLEVAFTCSASRANEFGGCAAFITATRTDWVSTSGWLSDKIVEHAKKQKRGNPKRPSRKKSK